MTAVASSWVRRRGQRTHEEFLHDSLNQSELLLLVAYFECVLKDVHRLLLKADPRAAFAETEHRRPAGENKQRSDRGRMIPLDRVFKSPYSEFLGGLVEQEVREVDRESIRTRHDYFLRCFKIGLGSEATLTQLDELFTLRNDVSHRIMETTAIRIPSDGQMDKARRLFPQVALSLWGSAAQRYPDVFP